MNNVELCLHDWCEKNTDAACVISTKMSHARNIACSTRYKAQCVSATHMWRVFCVYIKYGESTQHTHTIHTHGWLMCDIECARPYENNIKIMHMWLLYICYLIFVVGSLPQFHFPFTFAILPWSTTSQWFSICTCARFALIHMCMDVAPHFHAICKLWCWAAWRGHVFCLLPHVSPQDILHIMHAILCTNNLIHTPIPTYEIMHVCVIKMHEFLKHGVSRQT